MKTANFLLTDVVEKAENLAYLPTVVLKLMEIISDPDVSVTEVVGIIKKDQGLVARVFKVANSSFYGRVKKAEQLTDAVVTLGLRGLKSFVIAQAVKHVLTTSGMDDNTLWQHAVKVSVAASVLAKELQREMIEDALMGGLVHDIGKAFIVSVYPNAPALIQQKAAREGIMYYEAERKLLGFDHATVGAMITEKWNFPPRIVNVIRYHHGEEDVKNASADSLALARIVKLADMISNQYDVLSQISADARLEKLGKSNVLNLSSERLERLVEEIEKTWVKECENNLFS